MTVRDPVDWLVLRERRLPVDDSRPQTFEVVKARDSSSVDEETKLNAERYLKLRNLGFSTSKHVAHTLGGNALKAEASFHYWCTPQRLDQLLDELP